MQFLSGEELSEQCSGCAGAQGKAVVNPSLDLGKEVQDGKQKQSPKSEVLDAIGRDGNVIHSLAALQNQAASLI